MRASGLLLALALAACSRPAPSPATLEDALSDHETPHVLLAGPPFNVASPGVGCGTCVITASVLYLDPGGSKALSFDTGTNDYLFQDDDGQRVRANGFISSNAGPTGGFQDAAARHTPFMGDAGTAQVQILVGQTVLTAGAATPNFAPTFGPAFSSAPVCTCTDNTATAAVKCSATATVLTIAGTATDTINWHCFGQK